MTQNNVELAKELSPAQQDSALLSACINENLSGFSLISRRCRLEISEDMGGPSCSINGTSYNLLDGSFNLLVVQNNHAVSDAKFKKHAGEIYVSDLDMFSEKRRLIPICIVREGRNMFPAYTGGGGDNAPLCRSRNGLVPVKSGVGMPLNDVCAVLRAGSSGRVYKETVCPHAMWADDKKAACQNYFDVAFLDITDADMPFPAVMRIKSTAIASWKSFKNSFAQAVRVSRVRRKSMSNYCISLTAEDKGNYCVPVFTLEYDDNEKTSPFNFYEMALYYRDNLFGPMLERSYAPEEDRTPAVSAEERLAAIDVSSLEAGSETAQDFTL